MSGYGTTSGSKGANSRHRKHTQNNSHNNDWESKTPFKERARSKTMHVLGPFSKTKMVPQRLRSRDMTQVHRKEDAARKPKGNSYTNRKGHDRTDKRAKARTGTLNNSQP